MTALERREVALACMLAFVLSYLAGDCAADCSGAGHRVPNEPSSGLTWHPVTPDSSIAAEVTARLTD
jgi:hypothetical protein